MPISSVSKTKTNESKSMVDDNSKMTMQETIDGHSDMSRDDNKTEKETNTEEVIKDVVRYKRKDDTKETRRMNSENIDMQCSRQPHTSCATGKLNNIIDKTAEIGREKTMKGQFGPWRSKQENEAFSDDDHDL